MLVSPFLAADLTGSTIEAVTELIASGEVAAIVANGQRCVGLAAVERALRARVKR